MHAVGPSDFVFDLVNDQSLQDDLERFDKEGNAPLGTDREQIVQARLGQGRFRENLMDYWERTCAITDVNHPVVLTASHIKPWRLASNSERVDPYNGLLLLTQYDRLFDRGLITFSPNGVIQISKAFPEVLWDKTGICPDARLKKLDKEHQAYLDFHRAKVFVRTTKTKRLDDSSPLEHDS